MTKCTTQLDLWKIGGRRVTLVSSGRHITSNAGVLPLSRIERKLGLCERFARVLADKRLPKRVRHTVVDQMRQRVLQIACGYEDANDATDLRYEPAFQMALDRVAGEARSVLASQPTLSRMEQRDAEEMEHAAVMMLDVWAERVKGQSHVTIEMDSTDDETHGHQQLSFFQGYYKHTMYHPLLVFDGTGWPIATVLRPGNAHASAGAVELLRKIVAKLPKKTCVLFRADAGFASPEMYETCEELGIEYVIAQTVHQRYKEITSGALERVTGEFRRTGVVAREFIEFRYKAQTWNRERRVVAKAEAGGEKNPCVRYVVTNIERGTAEKIYDPTYTARGQSENYIKDLKNAMFADRLSCTRFVSNSYRLLLHTLAYMLMHELRTHLCETELARAQMDTLRLKLLKIGAAIKVTARRIWVQLSTRDPNRPLFEYVIGRLLAA